MTGQGGGTGASTDNYGVLIYSASRITAGGSGTVTVQGTGGASGGNYNYGVYVLSTSSQITSNGGNVSVTGQGGGTGTSGSNYGVLINSACRITAGGSGTVTVQGTGGATVGNVNLGVSVEINSQITSGGGNVSVTGQGSGTGTSGSNYGVLINLAGRITAGGSGTVTVQGTGGASSGSSNFGVLVLGANSQITSGGGNVSVTGQGSGTGTSGRNFGVNITSAGQITAGGSGTVTVQGTGGATVGNVNLGVSVEGTNSQITSNGGHVSVTGQGGGTGTSGSNFGVFITSAGRITAGGSGTVTVQGTGGATAGSSNFGVSVEGTNSQITSGGGNVSVTGQGSGTGTSGSNYGVLITSAGRITAGGSGTVTVQGTGGASAGSSNFGVWVLGANSQITSNGGNVSVTGIEGGGPSGIGIVNLISGSITTAINGGNISLIANSMNLRNPGSVSTQSGGTTTLRPYTNNVQIDLGTATDAIGGPLGLSDSELDRVTTGTLIIGNANSGAIIVSAAITRPASTNVQLISGGGFDTGGGTMLLDPGSPAAVKPTFNGTDVTASTLSFASDLSIAINGTTIGDGSGSTYSQLNVVGAVDLTGVDLLFTGTYVPTGSEVFTIVVNDGTDAITGTFTGLAQGATISNFRGSGLNGTISYIGGTGNDVVITVASSCTAPTFSACPTSPVTANTDPGQCSAAVTYTVTASGTPAPTIMYAFTGATTDSGSGTGSGETFEKGTTNVTVTASNGCSPNATCTFNVTIVDTEEPNIICPDNVTVNNDPGTCSAVVNFPLASTSDNCFTSSKNVLIIWDTNNATLNTLKNDIQAAGHTVSLSSVPEYQYNGTNPSLANFDVVIHLNGDAPAWQTDMPIAGQNALVDFVFNQNKTFIACEWNVYERAQGRLANFIPLILLTYNGFTYNVQAYTQVAGQSGNPVLADLPTSFTLPLSGANIGTAKVYPTDPSVVLMTSANGDAVVLRQLSTGGRIVNFQHSGNEGGYNALVNANVRKLFVNSVSSSLTLTQTTGLASGASFPVGQTVNTFMVTDASNNTNSCQQTVTVIDNQAPTFTCPSNTTVNTNGSANCAVPAPDLLTGIMDEADNCGTANLSQSPLANAPQTGIADGGTFTVTVTANDGNGNNNAAPCVVTVTVNDDDAPTLAGCPGNILLKTNDDGGADCSVTVNYTPPTFSDNCDGTGTATLQSGPASGTPLNVSGSPYTVVYTKTDLAGNAVLTNCTFTVTVQDNTLPTITCPGPMTVPTAPDNCSTPPLTYSVTTTDNCSSTVALVSGPASGSVFPLGVNTVVWRATDPANNSVTCAFTVTVGDVHDPSIVCPPSVSRNTDANQCTAIVTYATPTVNDNCTGWTLTRIGGLASGSAFPPGANMVRWQVSDVGGNIAICQFTVTVSDAQAPSITCPANIVRSTDAGLCTAVVTYASPTASDNCGLAAGSPSLHSAANTASGSAFPKGTTTVVWKATGTATPTANTATCSFTVTVNDTQLPGITCPSNITKGTDPGLCSAVTTYATPTATDNCPNVTAAHVSGGTSGSVFPKGQTTVVWRATDGAGLTKTCSFRVTVNDTENPVITCPSGQSANTTANTCASAPVTYTTPTATDNCMPTPTVVRIGGPVSGSAFPLGTTAVTWRAIDGAGRSSTCSFSVTVTDAAPPVVSCPGNIAATGSGSPCTAVVTYAAPTATDNCGVQSVFLLSGLPSGSSFPAGATVNTWRAVDNNGNSATCSFTVTVNCGSGAQASDDRTTGAQQTGGDGFSFQLSPNPATTEVMISAENIGDAGGELTVFDAQSRLMLRQRVSAEQPTVQWVFSEKNLAAGVYFVTLRAAGETLTKRLVVAKD